MLVNVRINGMTEFKISSMSGIGGLVLMISLGLNLLLGVQVHREKKKQVLFLKSQRETI